MPIGLLIVLEPFLSFIFKLMLKWMSPQDIDFSGEQEENPKHNSAGNGISLQIPILFFSFSFWFARWDVSTKIFEFIYNVDSKIMQVNL